MTFKTKFFKLFFSKTKGTEASSQIFFVIECSVNVFVDVVSYR